MGGTPFFLAAWPITRHRQEKGTGWHFIKGCLSDTHEKKTLVEFTKKINYWSSFFNRFKNLIVPCTVSIRKALVLFRRMGSVIILHSCLRLQEFLFAFRKWFFRISEGKPTVLTGSSWLPQHRNEDVQMLTESGCRQFLPNPVQFIIHCTSYIFILDSVKHQPRY